jgi:hypothetical protein
VKIVVSGCVVTGAQGEVTSTPTKKRPQGNGEKLKVRCAESRFLATLEPFFVGEYKTHRCEVKYTDMVS